MTRKSRWASALALLALLLLVAACGGSDGTNDQGRIGEAFNVALTIDNAEGPAPLRVSFYAVPSGGQAPYTYAWDFTSDGTVDSTLAGDTYTYNDSSTLSMVITDNDGREVTRLITITVTESGTSPGGETEPYLSIHFTANPQNGTVPFGCQFYSFVRGGKEPYHYAWDFDGDVDDNNDGNPWDPDSFLENPLWIYKEVGPSEGVPAEEIYTYRPILQITDGHGVTATNLEDFDKDGEPDFELLIKAMPPIGGMTVAAFANPVKGQAPLTVEFTGAVAGGSDSYEFTWNFGDGESAGPSLSSVTTHTYPDPGTYSVTLTVNDTITLEEKVATPVTVEATSGQVFELDIVSDITEGQVPLMVNFAANPINGAEPIEYQWDVFLDDVTDPDRGLTEPPVVATGAAVVTPHFTVRKNPTIHFGNQVVGDDGTGTLVPHTYLARCVAIDATGNVAVGQYQLTEEEIEPFLRIYVEPNTTYPYYEATRPLVIGQTIFPSPSAHPTVVSVTPTRWTPRANAATCSHVTGISFIMGGELLDESGNFERLVLPGDAAYMYVPRTAATGTGETNIGDFNTDTQGGGIIRLNDGYGPAFPGTAGDIAPPPALSGGPVPTQRSAPFTIVGSAAAVLIHELPESNPEGAYVEAHGDPDAFAPYPDCPVQGWNCDTNG